MKEISKESATKSRKPRSEKQIAVQFKKGKSGNPDGRPVLPAEMKQRLLNLTPQAITFLESIINNNHISKSLRMKAAEQVLDRGLGKPKQDIELSGSVEIPIVFDKSLEEESGNAKS